MGKGYHKPADDQEYWEQVPVSANSGSKQLYQLDDNTITMTGVLGKIRVIDKRVKTSGLSLSTDSYDPAMFDRFQEFGLKVWKVSSFNYNGMYKPVTLVRRVSVPVLRQILLLFPELAIVCMGVYHYLLLNLFT